MTEEQYNNLSQYAKLEYIDDIIYYISVNNLSNNKAAKKFNVSKQYVEDLYSTAWKKIPYFVINNMLNAIEPQPCTETVKREGLQKSIKEGLDALGMTIYTFAEVYKRSPKHLKKVYENNLEGISTKWLEEVNYDIQMIISPETVNAPEPYAEQDYSYLWVYLVCIAMILASISIAVLVY